jgi:hypothetical protein
MKSDSFSYAAFAKHTRIALHNYMEPIIADPTFCPDLDIAERMLSELDSYDQYHLVYALLMCFRVLPQRLIALLPDYLGHDDPAVYSTAINLLDQTEEQYLSRVVLEQAQRVLDIHPERQFLKDVVDRLEVRCARWRRSEIRGRGGSDQRGQGASP